MGLNSKVDRFFVLVSNLFTSLSVADLMMVLIYAIITTLIVGIAAGTMIFRLFMCVPGAFISVDRARWWI